MSISLIKLNKLRSLFNNVLESLKKRSSVTRFLKTVIKQYILCSLLLFTALVTYPIKQYLVSLWEIKNLLLSIFVFVIIFSVLFLLFRKIKELIAVVLGIILVYLILGSKLRSSIEEYIYVFTINNISNLTQRFHLYGIKESINELYNPTSKKVRVFTHFVASYKSEKQARLYVPIFINNNLISVKVANVAHIYNYFILNWQNFSDPYRRESINSAESTVELYNKNGICSGDCDDYTVLVASMLQIIGLRSGIVIVDGHAIPEWIVDKKEMKTILDELATIYLTSKEIQINHRVPAYDTTSIEISMDRGFYPGDNKYENKVLLEFEFGK